MDFKDQFTRTVAKADQLRKEHSSLVLECPDHHLEMEEDPQDPGFWQCPYTYAPAHPEQHCARAVLIHVEDTTT